MKMARGRSVEIAMALYVAGGMLVIHGFPYVAAGIMSFREIDGLIRLPLSLVCGLLTWTVMVAGSKNEGNVERYDSWGWSKPATRSLLVAMVVVLIGGSFFVFELWKGEFLPRTERFWQITGLLSLATLMWFAVYFRGYLTPINDKGTDLESLKLEHQEWIQTFQIFLMLAGIIFIVAGLSYIVGIQGREGQPELDPGYALEAMLSLFYGLVGWVLWIVRPVHGRCKEIRDHMIKARQEGKSSKQTGPGNDTEI